MTALAPPATIAFIGLGMMGRPMAARLAEAGFKLRLFDISQKAVSDFVGAHPTALATASPKAAAQGADALITMLPDGKVVRQAVIDGRDAAREGLAAGALVLDMSSSNPVDTQKLARDLAQSGVALLDAPVSGGVKRAVDGSLSIMVGGAAADLERVRPVFAAMGKTITLCGPAGAGHAMKALNNYLSAAGLVAMCEALVVGEAFGLDPGTMVDVFNSSTGRSNATEVKGRQFVVSRTFAAGFTTGLMVKDLRTAADVASHLALNMPMMKEAVAYWADANKRLGTAADHTEIFRYAEILAAEDD
ncbi:MAG: NAD(P)-dependent oxidoreductase [Alphaproteobacteria bacterium]|nr:NAD(P)-dependent oxidoreductase [Alphaproteobacteria bacterium]